MVKLGGTTLVVTGFPRSGTSMMMRMLMLGGISILADSKFKAPLHKHDPYGCFEVEHFGRLIRSKPKKWTKNKAIKIVTPYATWYPIDRPMKAIFMQRDLREIVTSLMAMRNAWDVDIAESVAWARGYLAHNEIPTLFIQYHDAVKFPKTTSFLIQDFLGVKLDTDKMVTAADSDARNKYKKDSSILGHDMPDKIISMSKDDYDDITVEEYNVL